MCICKSSEKQIFSSHQSMDYFVFEKQIRTQKSHLMDEKYYYTLAVLKPRPSFVFALGLLACNSWEWPHCLFSGFSFPRQVKNHERLFSNFIFLFPCIQEYFFPPLIFPPNPPYFSSPKKSTCTYWMSVQKFALFEDLPSTKDNTIRVHFIA